MQITKNFWWAEMVKSQYASRHKIYNEPPPEQRANLELLAKDFLQPLRDELKKGIVITSGYRCKKLNTAIGGAKNSQHMRGEAVDIECFSMSTVQLFDTVKNSGLEFDQLILEFYKPGLENSGWVHASYKKTGNRNQAFSIG